MEAEVRGRRLCLGKQEQENAILRMFLRTWPRLGIQRGAVAVVGGGACLGASIAAQVRAGS